MIRSWQVALCLAVFANCSQGAQISLTPASLIGGSAGYNAQFEKLNVLDSQTGVIHEPDQNSGDANGGFWLHPDANTSTPYFVVDLGAIQNIGSFLLFNTHNAQFNDRGTGNFTITASNNSGDLLNPTDTGVQIVSGTLQPETLANDNAVGLVPQNFNAAGGSNFRYIRFNALTVSAGGVACCGAPITSFGLNEIRVFAVPEPSGVFLATIGLCGLGFLARRRIA